MFFSGGGLDGGRGGVARMVTAAKAADDRPNGVAVEKAGRASPEPIAPFLDRPLGRGLPRRWSGLDGSAVSGERDGHPGIRLGAPPPAPVVDTGTSTPPAGTRTCHHPTRRRP